MRVPMRWVRLAEGVSGMERSSAPFTATHTMLQTDAAIRMSDSVFRSYEVVVEDEEIKVKC